MNVRRIWTIAFVLLTLVITLTGHVSAQEETPASTPLRSFGDVALQEFILCEKLKTKERLLWGQVPEAIYSNDLNISGKIQPDDYIKILTANNREDGTIRVQVFPSDGRVVGESKGRVWIDWASIVGGKSEHLMFECESTQNIFEEAIHADKIADGKATFLVRIENISGSSDLPSPFAPGVWVLHSAAGPLFNTGKADRGYGLEALAEDGNPAMLVDALSGMDLDTGVFNTPVGADSPGPLLPGGAYEFEVKATPDTPYLSFATMFVQSNDLFVGPGEMGIALFDMDGMAMDMMHDVTVALLLWDAGTEENEEPGKGPNQAPRQSAADTGPADGMATVHVVDDGFTYPDVSALVKVTIKLVKTADQDRGAKRETAYEVSVVQEPTQPAVPQVGEVVQIKNVRWHVFSAEDLGSELKGNGQSKTTKGRFIRVRFQFLNVGSDPLRYGGAELRDERGREYVHYDERFGSISEDEKCTGFFIHRLKPNLPTTCTTIYEVAVDAANLVFIASDLDGNENSETAIDLNIPAAMETPVHSSGEDVRVGRVRWRVISAEDLGNELKGNGNKETTEEHFIQVRFRFQNVGSETLKFGGVPLRDNLGREYAHLSGRWKYVPVDEACSGGGFLGLGDFRLKPNILTTCTTIYEVAEDATGLIFVASDLEGYTHDETKFIILNLSERANEKDTTPLSTQTSIPSPTPTVEQAVPRFTVAREVVNVRQGPGTNFSIIAKVSEGMQFEVIGQNLTGDWYQFCCVNGEQGWIYAPLLQVENPQLIPAATPTPAATSTIAAAAASLPTTLPTPEKATDSFLQALVFERTNEGLKRLGLTIDSPRDPSFVFSEDWIAAAVLLLLSKDTDHPLDDINESLYLPYIVAIQGVIASCTNDPRVIVEFADATASIAKEFGFAGRVDPYDGSGKLIDDGITRLVLQPQLTN